MHEIEHLAFEFSPVEILGSGPGASGKIVEVILYATDPVAKIVHFAIQSLIFCSSGGICEGLIIQHFCGVGQLAFHLIDIG